MHSQQGRACDVALEQAKLVAEYGVMHGDVMCGISSLVKVVEAQDGVVHEFRNEATLLAEAAASITGIL